MNVNEATTRVVVARRGKVADHGHPLKRCAARQKRPHGRATLKIGATWRAVLGVTIEIGATWRAVLGVTIEIGATWRALQGLPLRPSARSGPLPTLLEGRIERRR